MGSSHGATALLIAALLVTELLAFPLDDVSCSERQVRANAGDGRGRNDAGEENAPAISEKQSAAAVTPQPYISSGTTKRLLFIGQDLGSIAEYVARFGDTAAGYTSYTGIRDNDSTSLLGLNSSTEYGAGVQHARAMLTKYPQSALQLGIDLVGTLEKIDAGKCDATVRRLAKILHDEAGGRRVYLRIGYEFDGPWNKYEPETYKAAFRRMVNVLREEKVDFAAVWQSSTSGSGSYGNRQLDAWYPGKEYVDVIGLSYFHRHESQDALLKFARAEGKPVMICESAPRGWDLRHGTQEKKAKDVSAPWEEWFKPFFDFIEDNSDVIKAVTYVRLLISLLFSCIAFPGNRQCTNLAASRHYCVRLETFFSP